MSLSGYADPSYGTETYASGGLFFGAHGMPRCSCWVSFTTNPADAPVWVDLTDWLRGFTIKRGRQYELDRFAAGTATITLDNRDRRFDPTYTASPYYPNVLPMKRIQLRATWGIDYTIFDGYVDGWPQSYDQPNEAKVDVSCTDAFKILGLAKYPQSTYEYEVLKDSPVHWWRLNEKQGTAILDRIPTASVAGVINPGPGKGLVNYSATGMSPFDSDGAIELVDPGDSLTRGPYFTIPTAIGTTSNTWTIELWVRDLETGSIGALLSVDESSGDILQISTSGATNKPETLDIAWADSGGASHSVSLTGVASVLQAPGWHMIHVRSTGTRMQVWLDATYFQDAAFTGTLHPAAIKMELPEVFNLALPAGTTMAYDEIAFYNTSLADARLTAHHDAATLSWSGEYPNARITRALDAAGFSSTARSLDVGLSQMGSAVLSGQTILDHIQQVELAEAGDFFFTADGTATFKNRRYLRTAPGLTPAATFGDSAGEMQYSDVVVAYDDTKVINDAKVTRSEGTTQVASDATSQAEYLVRTVERTDVHTLTDTDSLSIAQDLVARFKNPAVRVESMTVKPQRDPDNLWPLVLSLDLLDVVTVKRRPQVLGSAISQNVAIEGIAHTVTPEFWSTTYQLGSVPAPAWTIEDPTYGAVDSVAVVTF